MTRGIGKYEIVYFNFKLEADYQNITTKPKQFAMVYLKTQRGGYVPRW